MEAPLQKLLIIFDMRATEPMLVISTEPNRMTCRIDGLLAKQALRS